MKVEFFKHNVNQTDIDRVNQVLNSLFLTTGETVAEFEGEFARYLGCKHVVGVTSCTAAMQLCLLALGVGAGDEVITTPMTFIATANAIIHAGATPVFVDVEPDTGNIDSGLIEAAVTERTKAILPVHLYGQMCDMKRIGEIAGKHHLAIIEDAAHALEAERDGVRPGGLSDAACFSFYPTKSITSGEGGAIGTNDEGMADTLRKLRLHGMSKGAADRYSKRYEHWDMEILGWKYNMDNIQAALLLNQLDRVEGYWQRREDICRMYEQAFEDIPGLAYMKVLPGSKSARHLFTIMVPPGDRDPIMMGLQERGIGVAVNFRAVHLMTYYQNAYGYRRGTFPVAERIGDSTITLPLYARLTNEEVEYVIEGVKETCAG